MDSNKEFAINWLKGSDYAEVTAPNRTTLKGKIMKMAAKEEEGVKIMVVNPDGSIVAHVPVKYVTVRKPRTGTNNSSLADWKAKKAAEQAETIDDLPFGDIEDDDEDEEEEPDEFS